MESRDFLEAKQEAAGRGPEHEAEAARSQGESARDRCTKTLEYRANRPLGQALLYTPEQGWTPRHADDLKVPIPTPEPHQSPQLFCASPQHLGRKAPTAF